MSEEEKKETIKEARIMEALQHPNIVKFREVYKTQKQKLCIVMDYADGGDLAKKIKDQKGAFFKESQILDWFTQIALAIKHVHDRKIIHRDLKCQNIFLTRYNKILLGDFGIARVLNHTREKVQTMVGTPYYLSPEIIDNKPYSFKSDVWSLGIILYEISALRPPFDAMNLHALAMKIVRGQYSPIPSNYSKDLKQLVSVLLQVDPNKRPNIHEVLQLPIIQERIKRFLTETIRQKEFSHTILHKQNLVNQKINLEIPQTTREKVNIGSQFEDQKNNNQIQINNQFLSPQNNNLIFNFPNNKNFYNKPQDLLIHKPNQILQNNAFNYDYKERDRQIQLKQFGNLPVNNNNNNMKEHIVIKQLLEDKKKQLKEREQALNQQQKKHQQLLQQQAQPHPSNIIQKQFMPKDVQENGNVSNVNNVNNVNNNNNGNIIISNNNNSNLGGQAQQPNAIKENQDIINQVQEKVENPQEKGKANPNTANNNSNAGEVQLPEPDEKQIQKKNNNNKEEQKKAWEESRQQMKRDIKERRREQNSNKAHRQNVQIEWFGQKKNSEQSTSSQSQNESQGGNSNSVDQQIIENSSQLKEKPNLQKENVFKEKSMKKDIPVEIYLPKNSKEREVQENLIVNEEQSNMPSNEEYLKQIKDELEQLIKDSSRDERQSNSNTNNQGQSQSKCVQQSKAENKSTNILDPVEDLNKSIACVMKKYEEEKIVEDDDNDCDDYDGDSDVFENRNCDENSNNNLDNGESNDNSENENGSNVIAIDNENQPENKKDENCKVEDENNQNKNPFTNNTSEDSKAQQQQQQSSNGEQSGNQHNVLRNSLKNNQLSQTSQQQQQLTNQKGQQTQQKSGELNKEETPKDTLFIQLEEQVSREILQKIITSIKNQIKEIGYENLQNLNFQDAILSLGLNDQNQSLMLQNYCPLILTYILMDENQMQLQ